MGDGRAGKNSGSAKRACDPHTWSLGGAGLCEGAQERRLGARVLRRMHGQSFALWFDLGLRGTRGLSKDGGRCGSRPPGCTVFDTIRLTWTDLPFILQSNTNARATVKYGSTYEQGASFVGCFLLFMRVFLWSRGTQITNNGPVQGWGGESKGHRTEMSPKLVTIAHSKSNEPLGVLPCFQTCQNTEIPQNHAKYIASILGKLVCGPQLFA